MSYTFASQPSASLFNSVPFAQTSRTLAMAAVHIQAHALKALIRLQIESLAFVQSRCQQDVKLIDDLITFREVSQHVWGIRRILPRRGFGLRQRNPQTDVRRLPDRRRFGQICEWRSRQRFRRRDRANHRTLS